jgi:hypothetical protein
MYEGGLSEPGCQTRWLKSFQSSVFFLFVFKQHVRQVTGGEFVVYHSGLHLVWDIHNNFCVLVPLMVSILELF